MNSALPLAYVPLSFREGWRALASRGGFFSLVLLAFLVSPAAAQTLPGPLVPPNPASTSSARPEVVTTYQSVSGPLNDPLFHGVRSVYGGEMTLQAGQVQGDLSGRKFQASGDVRLHEADTTLSAETLQFDRSTQFDKPTQSGEATQATLARRPFTLRAEKLTFTPALVQADNADIATVPPDVSPDLDVRVGNLTFDAHSRELVLRNATLYLFHSRLLTLRRYSHRLPKPGEVVDRRQGLLPQFGYSGRYGLFAAYASGARDTSPSRYSFVLSTRRSVQARVTDAQILRRQAAPTTPVSPPRDSHDYLGALRALTTIPQGPVPDGDPLRFHDFLPDQNPIRLFDAPPLGLLQSNEELSYHLEASGRRRDDLYVTRVPEVSLYGRLPLTHVPLQPTATDAAAFREYLSRPVVYLDAQAMTGYYREEPTSIAGGRSQFQLGLSTRPLLVAPNTVILPRLSYVANRYPGRTLSYSYTQVSLALDHYFSDRRAIGLQYLTSAVHGDSPFNFDVLDTASELDGRFQIGDHRLALAGLVRYDLLRHDVIDYKITVAPSQRGFIPVFSY
ncbi:MAG: hypothetical protein M3Y13_10895, partial [Armatimonadota bacterium]|nr:hypothetical protein [Armatimonadota bacterium]